MWLLGNGSKNKRTGYYVNFSKASYIAKVFGFDMGD